MKISKIRKVKTPTRGTDLSAGIDFYVPEFTDDFKEILFEKNLNEISFEDLYKKNEIVLKPNCKILIPSGIKVNFNDSNPRVLIAFNKSSVASKLGLDVLACVIDQDYQGEIHINLTNTTKKIVKIKSNDKIVQCVMLPVFYEDIQLVDLEDLYSEVTTRGEGGFGSTGK